MHVLFHPRPAVTHACMCPHPHVSAHLIGWLIGACDPMSCPFPGGVGGDQAAAIAAAIHHNSELRTLLLGSNRISETGIRALAEALGHNPRSVLHTLDLEGNGSPGRAFGQLSAALMANAQRHRRTFDRLVQTGRLHLI